MSFVEVGIDGKLRNLRKTYQKGAQITQKQYYTTDIRKINVKDTRNTEDAQITQKPWCSNI